MLPTVVKAKPEHQFFKQAARLPASPDYCRTLCPRKRPENFVAKRCAHAENKSLKRRLPLPVEVFSLRMPLVSCRDGTAGRFLREGLLHENGAKNSFHNGVN